MSQTASVADNNKVKTPGTKPRVPPEPRFWKRYSPHHEFPLSGATSVALHMLAGAMLLFGGYLLIKLGLSEDDKPLPFDTIEIAGGGGDKQGIGDQKGDNFKPTGQEVAQQNNNNPVVAPPIKDPLLAPTNPDYQLPEFIGKGRYMDGNPGENAAGFSQLSEDARKQLFQGLVAGKGQDGPGSKGGKGKGEGDGTGDLKGSGKGNLSIRQQRVLRWTMVFNTRDGGDYRRQLAGLDAILAIPHPSGGYEVIRDLSVRRPKGKVEDLTKIQRIFWVDNDPQSVQSLASALGMEYPPPQFVAFFPQSWEAKLLDAELKYRNRKEEDIKETRFQVIQRGGRFEPQVVDQRY